MPQKQCFDFENGRRQPFQPFFHTGLATLFWAIFKIHWAKNDSTAIDQKRNTTWE